MSSIESDKTTTPNPNQHIPLLPLRDIVLYPFTVTPLFVGRKKSIHALELAINQDKQILLAAQINPGVDNPAQQDIYSIGCVANILQLLKLPDGTVKVLVEGKKRVKITSYFEDEQQVLATVVELSTSMHPDDKELTVLTKSLREEFENYVKTTKKVPEEVLNSIASLDHPERLADTIAMHMPLKLPDKQKVLELVDVKTRIEFLIRQITSETELIEVEKKIRGRIKKQMEKSQRDYYLNEQMKAIQRELGTTDETQSIYDELMLKIDKAGMTEEAKQKAVADVKKLKNMGQSSSEANLVRNYVEWLLKLPWKKRTKARTDLAIASKILNRDHYGLEEVKQRILEFLAVQKRVKKLSGPILCLVGPPGVGKTSLGKSIAKSTNRKFVRMALGGVRDEAEIRGHRRTYIGSMPGRIIQRMTKVDVKNPLFLLDEIDKLSMDHRGDPAAALLEVLDPEQNTKFNDHYIEVDFDLSQVMFVCTANSLNIPPALLDRMEIIRIPGYTEDEKVHIATQYLVPKQLEKNGLKKKELEFTEESILNIIRFYTREAGVRSLEREISKVCRKVVMEIESTSSVATVKLQANNLEEYLGVRKFKYGIADEKDQIGQVTGLAWTQVGGELLRIEAVSVPGKGMQTRTGSLGDVMQESIQTAFTIVRSRAISLGIKPDFYESVDIHIHVPEGATPKDGPSAGIAMCTAIVSVLTKIPVRANVAMTGEITLRGEVLAIGGLKEKLLAAHRGGIKTVIIPADNQSDLKEIPDNIKKDLEIKPVKWIDEVLEIALTHLPNPLPLEGVVPAETKDVPPIEAEDNLSTH